MILIMNHNTPNPNLKESLFIPVCSGLSLAGSQEL